MYSPNEVLKGVTKLFEGKLHGVGTACDWRLMQTVHHRRNCAKSVLDCIAFFQNHADFILLDVSFHAAVVATGLLHLQYLQNIQQAQEGSRQRMTA